MIIGANAPWSGIDYEEEGRIYIFRKTTSGWVLENEFLSENSKANDRFGNTVAIYDKYAIVGSGLTFVHIYKYDGKWELLRTEPIYARTISHQGNNFMIAGDYQLIVFTLGLEGSINYNSTDFDFDITGIAGGGNPEIIEMRENLALLDMEEIDICYLLKYENNNWSNIKVFSPDEEESCTFYGLAIADNSIVIGGEDQSNNKKSHRVYFRNY